jgi:DnaJ-class molecular chaperone
MIDCPNCYGSGKDTFVDQNGVHEENCELCDGTGEIESSGEDE